MFILNEGISKLKLENSIPESLRQASLMKQSPVEALLKIIDQGHDPLVGELFWWPPGETQREAVIGIDLRDKLLRYRPFTETCYAAEVRSSKRAPHARSFEMTDTLTAYDVKDLGPASPLPLWDRGHGFFGSTGAGICLHVDQAWWSNVAKNFSGQKLVALWGPGTNVLQTCGGELFRKPLCPRHLSALQCCKRIALLRPGDVACFTGGLPHTTMVVGEALNLTFYESFLNWNCENLDLLLSGLQRSIDQPWWQNNMEPQFVETVLQDILQVADKGHLADSEKQNFVALLGARPLTSARLVGFTSTKSSNPPFSNIGEGA
eukprot:symbB.v1.2.026080.t1/scaffold2580.1/size77259/6